MGISPGAFEIAVKAMATQPELLSKNHACKEEGEKFAEFLIAVAQKVQEQLDGWHG